MRLPQAVQILHKPSSAATRRLSRASRPSSLRKLAQTLALPLLLTIALGVAGCSEDGPSSPDASEDALGTADSTTVDAFDPLYVAPYSCDYAAAGSFTKLPSDECNLIVPDCANAAHTCVLTDLGTRCLPAGTDACGFPCERVNDCARGLMCVGEPLTCRAACRPGDPCPGNTVCRAVSGRSDAGFCPVPCSVLEPDCPGGDGCYLLFGRMECAPTPASPKGLGQSCSSADACAKGLLCQDASDLRCLQPCSTEGAFGCPQGEDCQILQGLAPLGVCLSQ